MNRRKLPVGIPSFRKIRDQNCYQVDKTPFIQTLIDGGSHYFLSRPGRSGKSLFLDRLKEHFEGNQVPFEGWRARLRQRIEGVPPFVAPPCQWLYADYS